MTLCCVVNESEKLDENSNRLGFLNAGFICMFVRARKSQGSVLHLRPQGINERRIYPWRPPRSLTRRRSPNTEAHKHHSQPSLSTKLIDSTSTSTTTKLYLPTPEQYERSYYARQEIRKKFPNGSARRFLDVGIEQLEIGGLSSFVATRIPHSQKEEICTFSES